MPFIPLSAGLAATAQYGSPGYGHGYWDGWGHMMPFGGMFFWIAILIAIIILVTVLARKSGKAGDRPAPNQESPLDILKKRYARGELTKEEFERMKREVQ
ncbi:MAG: SHOCT domain-containing protein [Desulfohalobiaceae bacterium]|nr:SHOCT domain-containing protein [Desulfohalobiaceae bacterium]